MNGNIDSASATVTVIDSIKPTVLTQNTTIYLDASGQASIAVVDIDNGSLDNCAIQTSSLDSTNFDCSEVGVNTVWLRVTDVNGNIDSASATVTVIDSIKPIILNCPNDIVVNNDLGNCSAIVNWLAPNTVDNCSIDSLVVNFTPGSTFNIGVTTVTYIAYDSNNNTDTCSFTVTVIDNEVPVILNIPSDITVNNDSISCSVLVNWTLPQANDNCSVDSLVSNFTPGTLFPVGVTVVEYIAYDSSMNTDTARFTITVNDSIAPQIECQSDTVICENSFTFNLPVGTDNCGVLSIVQVEGISSGQFYPVGVTLNKFIITDVNGNLDSCSFTVTRDSIPSNANAGVNSNICIDTVILAANTPTIGVGSWSSISTLINFDDPTNSSTIARGLQRGANRLIWSINNGVCAASSDTVIVTFDEEPTISNAGVDQIICDDNIGALNGNNPVVGIGTWTLLQGSATINNPNNPATTISNLSLGANRFEWTINNGTCSASTDIVEIIRSDNPSADAGPDVSVFREDGVTLSVFSDSSNAQGVNYQWQPSMFLDDPMSATTSSNNSLEETTLFIVQVINQFGCIGTDSILVTVVNDFTLPTAFTPNNDGFNDTWEIKNLDSEEIISYRVSVFDNFGLEIFSTNNYQPWDGTFNGQSLPSGSYYFIIEIVRQNSGKKVETGSITILR